MNLLQFLIFKGEFFAIFILLGLFLSNFHSLRVNSLHFSPVRVNFFQFLPLKGKFFQIFLPWRDWRRRLIDWSIKIALRVVQSLIFPEDVCVSRRPMVTICGALIRSGRNCWEILRQIIAINIYIFYDSESHFTANFAHILHPNFSTVWNMHK